MGDNLIMEVQRAGDGRTLATVNGKLYTLLAGYDDRRADGWFFLAVAGHTPLKAEDLAPYWQVVKSGPVYLAFSQRHFSYHLAHGEGTEAPDGCDWPRLKAPPDCYAFVGPSEQAVEAQVCLALEQYRPDLSLEDLLRRAIHVSDEAGRGPDAFLIRL